MVSRFYFWWAIFLLGINLRPSFTVVSPLLPTIQTQLSLSASMVGLLSAIPIFMLGVSGLCAGWLADQNTGCVSSWSTRRFLTISLACLGIAIAMRAIGLLIGGGVSVFFLSTAFIGICTGMVQVFIPALIKKMPVAHHALASGILGLATCLGSACAAAITQPVTNWLAGRWEWAMGLWALPVLVCVVWCWNLPENSQRYCVVKVKHKYSIFMQPLAWAICLHMALQTMLSQAIVTWLPTLMEDRGASATNAGFLLSAVIIAQLITALAGASWASRYRTQGVALGSMYILALFGFAMSLQLDGAWQWTGAAMIGLGQGGTYSIGLYLIVSRAANSLVAVKLTSMSQVVGYGIAASGPWLFGFFHDIAGSWGFVLPLFFSITLAGILCAVMAGQNRVIGLEST